MNRTKEVIDLHIHSNNSDGTFSTQELIDMLKLKNASIISFTDHDNVGCYYDLKFGHAKLYPGVCLIPGVELSCSVNGSIRDILGYGISISHMFDYLENKYSLESRIKKQQYILEQFMQKCKILGLKFKSNIEVKEGKKAEAFVVVYSAN